MDKITKFDVFRYVANELTRERRIQVEEAAKTDPDVQRWLQELTPTEEELVKEAIVKLPAIDSPEARKIAAETYLSVQRDEEE